MILISIYLPFLVDLVDGQVVVSRNEADLVYFSRAIQLYGHANIYFIGGIYQGPSFPESSLSDPVLQSQIRETLWSQHCLPLFFPNRQLDVLLNRGGFKVKFIQSTHIQDMKQQYTQQAEELRAIETLFGQQVLAVLENIKTQTALQGRRVYVLVNDQQLALLSTLLKQHQLQTQDCPDMFFQQTGQFRMGMHMNMAFPATERLKLKPDSKITIRAILLYDIIICDDFEHARPFFCCLSQYFGVDYYSRQGILTIPFDGREVQVVIVGLHINTQHILWVRKQLPHFQRLHQHIILSIDSQTELSEFQMKFNLLLRYFSEKSQQSVLKDISMLQVVKRKVSWGPADDEWLHGLRAIAQKVNQTLHTDLIQLQLVEEGNQKQLIGFMASATIFLKTCLNSICSP